MTTDQTGEAAACSSCGRVLPELGTPCPHCGADTAELAPDLPGIPGFRILGLLGQGGMGAVYRAHEEALDRVVAIKLMRGAHAHDPDARARFLREARTMATVEHPRIVRVYSFGEAAGRPYLVMELVPGETLASRIQRGGPLEVREALGVARQVAEALEVAWAKGIVHRDVKPSNILLDAGAQVRVMDFGLAKPIEVQGERLTHSGYILGSPHYLPPELAEGRPADLRSDLYSLGITLYEMLAGAPPFQGPSPYAIVDQHLHRPLPRLRDRRPDLASGIEALVDWLTAKDPGARPTSHAALRERLDALLAGTDTAGALARATARTHGPWRWAGLALAIGLVAVLGGWTMHRLWRLPSPLGGALRHLVAPSVAVLPFQNLSEDTEDEYFADGLTEDVIVQLSTIPGLRVISRTSAMVYKGSGKRLPEIAGELGVDLVLEGSVRRHAGQVGIVARLIDARTDSPRWADSYERPLEDLFTVRADIARAVAEAAECPLTGEARARLERRPTGSTEAYDAYLKGRELLAARRGAAELQEAIRLFRKALEQDPELAEAYAGLARADAGLSVLTRDTSLAEQATRFAERAITLDPNSADAYFALGLSQQVANRVDSAQAAYGQAIELNPNHVGALLNLGSLVFDDAPAGAMERFRRAALGDPRAIEPKLALARYAAAVGADEEARALVGAALELDPRSATALVLGGQLDILGGDLAGAVRRFAEAERQAPSSPVVRRWAGWLAMVRGDLGEALREFEQYGSLVPGGGRRNVWMAWTLGRLGRQAEADALVSATIAAAEGPRAGETETSDQVYETAGAYVLHGDREKAVASLPRLLRTRFFSSRFVAMDPIFEPLHGDPAFDGLLETARRRAEELRRELFGATEATPK